jgi:adenine/guanine/hypoxanthine permease
MPFLSLTRREKCAALWKPQRWEISSIGLARIDLADLSNAIPITLTLLITVLTNNLINGMALGTLSLILILVATGRAKEITSIVWGLGVVFLFFFYVTTMLM